MDSDPVKDLLGPKSRSDFEELLKRIEEADESLAPRAPGSHEQGFVISGPSTGKVKPGWDERAPYPWCHGFPTIEDCVKRGYCAKDPNCGE
jgi:hypothetical protein